MGRCVMDRAARLDAIQQLHCEVDREVQPLAQRHRGRLQCKRGCFECCTDDLSVLEVEAEAIRERHAELLASSKPAPIGRCAFLDADGACRIYESRPYVCRTQGLPLRWLEEDDEGAIVEQRDICPLNLEGPGLASLPDADCFQLGIYEQRLVSLQMQGFSRLNRVHLRSFFSSD